MKAKYTPTPWKVEPVLRPDLDDDPMGQYRVLSAELNLTQRYFAADPESPELDSVHEENAANAKRIEDCVNSCKWFDDPCAEIPALVECFTDLVAQMQMVADHYKNDPLNNGNSFPNQLLEKAQEIAINFTKKSLQI